MKITRMTFQKYRREFRYWRYILFMLAVIGATPWNTPLMLPAWLVGLIFSILCWTLAYSQGWFFKDVLVDEGDIETN